LTDKLYEEHLAEFSSTQQTDASKNTFAIGVFEMPIVGHETSARRVFLGQTDGIQVYF